MINIVERNIALISSVLKIPIYKENVQKKIPFIIRRPIPNGGSEYWKVNDLKNIDKVKNILNIKIFLTKWSETGFRQSDICLFFSHLIRYISIYIIICLNS